MIAKIIRVIKDQVELIAIVDANVWISGPAECLVSELHVDTNTFKFIRKLGLELLEYGASESTDKSTESMPPYRAVTSSRYFLMVYSPAASAVSRR